MPAQARARVRVLFDEPRAFGDVLADARRECERVAAARSLERALAVYEKAAAGGSGGDETRSPSSSPSDVAAALTDLAVLHLEAGRDELGKPLLRRALEIQRRALGDSHPDVVAIRDVLEAE